MIKKLSKYTLMLCLCALGLFIAVSAIVAIRLQMAPITLTHLLPYVEKRLEFYKYAVEMQDLTMSYDGRLVISGNNVKLVDKKSREGLVNLESATLRFSNSNLLRLKFVPREVHAKGLKVATELTETEVKIGDKHSFPLQKGQGDVQVNLPLVAMLESMHKDVSLSGWQKFEIEDAQIQFKDSVKGVSWAFTDLSIFLDSDFDNISARLAGLVKRSGITEELPLSLNLSHNWGEKNLNVKAEFSELSGDIVKGYIPNHLTDMVKSRLSGQVETDWNDITLFDGLKVKLQAPETVVTIPKVFSQSLMFNSIDLDGEFSVNRFGRLTLNKLTAVDPEGVTFTATGDVSKVLSEDPQLDIALRVSDADLGTVLEYVPDNVSPNGIKWVNEHLNMDAKVKDFLLTFKPAAPMPFCGVDCGFEIQFNYSGLNVSGIKTLPPATGLAGKFFLGQNEIRVSSKYGSLSNQSASNIKVRLDELFSTGETFVYIDTEATGPAAEVVRHIKEMVPDSKIPPLEGNHTSHVKLKMSTRKEKQDDIRYDVSSTLTDLKLVIPEGKRSLKTEKAEFNGRNGYSYFKSEAAVLEDMPVSLVWSLEKKGEDEHQVLELKGEETPEVLLKDVPETIAGIEGVVPFTLKMMQKNKEPQNIWVESTLNNNVVDLKLFNWKKEAGVPLFAKAKGVFEQGKSVKLSSLQVTGDGVDVQGTVSKDLRDKEGIPHFNASVFHVGERNHLKNFSFDGQNLVVKGRSLDVRNLLKKSENKEKSPLEDIVDFTADIHVDDAFLAEGQLWNFVRGTVKKKGENWDRADVSAQINGTPVQMSLKDTENPQVKQAKHIKVDTEHAGMFLRSLGIYDKMRGGRLSLNAHFNESFTEGQGHVNLNDVRIVKAPLLVKLISFFSLEELLSSQSGIKFGEAYGEFVYKDHFLNINRIKMSGPSIGLRALASVHVKENVLAARGQMIPAEGLNKAVSNIPLIGTILTGSQEGVSVANFSIIGSMKDPSVSVNPLSLLTPGLVKDFFSGLMGDDGESVESVQNDLKKYLEKRNTKKNKK
ncbi:MAG: AsmA-like C-terminal domain-containing protein [Pseudomonadota bacterium]|nr:AsmA-like C-terminal domain-containing protein [Pseudomonadota bacterium]